MFAVKVWDQKWHLQLVFVGHFGAVSTLAVYPYGPLIMSASMDKTIRIWSLETCDEVDRLVITLFTMGILPILSIPNAWFLSQWNTLPDTAVYCGIEMSTCTLTVHSALFQNLLKLLIIGQF